MKGFIKDLILVILLLYGIGYINNPNNKYLTIGDKTYKSEYELIMKEGNDDFKTGNIFYAKRKCIKVFVDEPLKSQLLSKNIGHLNSAIYDYKTMISTALILNTNKGIGARNLCKVFLFGDKDFEDILDTLSLFINQG